MLSLATPDTKPLYLSMSSGWILTLFRMSSSRVSLEKVPPNLCKYLGEQYTLFFLRSQSKMYSSAFSIITR